MILESQDQKLGAEDIEQIMRRIRAKLQNGAIDLNKLTQIINDLEKGKIVQNTQKDP